MKKLATFLLSLCLLAGCTMVKVKGTIIDRQETWQEGHMSLLFKVKGDDGLIHYIRAYPSSYGNEDYAFKKPGDAIEGYAFE